MKTLTLASVLIGVLALLGLTFGCGAELIEEAASLPTEPETLYEADTAPSRNETTKDELIITEDEKDVLRSEIREVHESEEVAAAEEVETEEILPVDDESEDALNEAGGDGEAGEEPDDGADNAPAEQGKHLYGRCTITHYCSCSICAGQWAGSPTASGAWPQANHTVANGSLPFGTIIEINGQEYVVEDRGVGDFWIDIYCDSHDEALSRGMYEADVYILD